jgi:hypothetical protein
MHCNYIFRNELAKMDPNCYRLSGPASKENVRIGVPLCEIAARIRIESSTGFRQLIILILR